MTNLLLTGEALAPVTIASLLETLTSIVTFLIGQVGTVFGIIQSYPIAMIGLGVALAFTSVKFVKYILGI